MFNRSSFSQILCTSKNTLSDFWFTSLFQVRSNSLTVRRWFPFCPIERYISRTLFNVSRVAIYLIGSITKCRFVFRFLQSRDVTASLRLSIHSPINVIQKLVNFPFSAQRSFNQNVAVVSTKRHENCVELSQIVQRRESRLNANVYNRKHIALPWYN